METSNAKVSILHVITAAKNASPFDVNMAFDAGYDKIMSYTNVQLAEVTALTQDAIFSRSPSGIKREAIFIGGRDIDLAMQMLFQAKAAMFAPFQCSLFADPSGAFTTAAAMVAKVEYYLKLHFGTTLLDQRISIFGATGPVGATAAIIAAMQGAKVQLVAHKDVASVTQKAKQWNDTYQINLQVVDGIGDAAKCDVVEQSDVLLCAAAAGIEVITHAHLAHAKKLKVAADVNAVVPLGISGVGVQDNGVKIVGVEDQALGSPIGIGALAIGQLKYQVQHQLLKQMLESHVALTLDFIAAFVLSQSLVAQT
jgi:methylene-tetrahydromethanopterin dehydrogenase